jgi:hypothetical protein
MRGGGARFACWCGGAERGNERAAQANPAAWFVSDSLSIVLPPLEIVRLLICSWDINICTEVCKYGMHNSVYCIYLSSN